MLTAALCSGRLSESCAILRSCQQALEQELRRCLLAVDRVQAAWNRLGARSYKMLEDFESFWKIFEDLF